MTGNNVYACVYASAYACENLARVASVPDRRAREKWDIFRAVCDPERLLRRPAKTRLK